MRSAAGSCAVFVPGTRQPGSRRHMEGPGQRQLERRNEVDGRFPTRRRRHRCHHRRRRLHRRRGPGRHNRRVDLRRGDGDDHADAQPDESHPDAERRRRRSGARRCHPERNPRGNGHAHPERDAGLERRRQHERFGKDGDFGRRDGDDSGRVRRHHRPDPGQLRNGDVERAGRLQPLGLEQRHLQQQAGGDVRPSGRHGDFKPWRDSHP